MRITTLGRVVIASFFAAASALCFCDATPPENEAPAESAPASQPAQAQGINDAQRKGVIAANIPFGKDEGDGFWPLYRDYRRDVGELQARRAQVVAEYAEIFRTMTGDEAKSMVETFLQADEGIVRLKRDYLKKFRKFLPETKVTRVFMIDDRIDAAIAAQLLAKAPVAGDPPAQ